MESTNVVRYERHNYHHGRYCRCRGCNPPSKDELMTEAAVVVGLGVLSWLLSRR